MKYILFCMVLTGLLLVNGCEKENPPPPPFEDLDVDACMVPVSSDTFEILTWNVEQFPLDVNVTVSQLSQIIERQGPDLIALQEITQEHWLKIMADSLEGWEYQIYPDDFLSLAFLYKTGEVVVQQDAEPLMTGNSYAFPRPPLHMVVSHTAGRPVHLINIHLKCCGGAENVARRDSASSMLKQYIDDNLNDEPVILLGDFNDVIYGIPDNQNPFINFINDSLNYKFADMDIARGDKGLWSYPGYPSHIDHILITNELYGSWTSIGTLTYDLCDRRYLDYISDHRPLMIKLVY